MPRASSRLIARPSPVPSSARSAAVHLHERLEDLLQLVARRCRRRCRVTRIAHRVARRAAHASAMRPPGVGELDRVGEQVEQDLPQLLAVGAHGERRRRSASRVVARAASRGAAARRAPRHVGERPSRAARRRCRSSTCRASSFAKFSTSLMRPSRCCWLRWIRASASRCASVTGPWMPELEQLGVAADRVERRAQLVAHRGEELRSSPGSPRSASLARRALRLEQPRALEGERALAAERSWRTRALPPRTDAPARTRCRARRSDSPPMTSGTTAFAAWPTLSASRESSGKCSRQSPADSR